MVKLIAFIVTAVLAGILIGFFSFLVLAFTGSWKAMVGVLGIVAVVTIVELVLARLWTR